MTYSVSSGTLNSSIPYHTLYYKCCFLWQPMFPKMFMSFILALCTRMFWPRWDGFGTVVAHAWERSLQDCLPCPPRDWQYCSADVESMGSAEYHSSFTGVYWWLAFPTFLCCIHNTMNDDSIHAQYLCSQSTGWVRNSTAHPVSNVLSPTFCSLHLHDWQNCLFFTAVSKCACFDGWWLRGVTTVCDVTGTFALKFLVNEFFLSV